MHDDGPAAIVSEWNNCLVARATVTIAEKEEEDEIPF